jgi:hypothetical protein
LFRGDAVDRDQGAAEDHVGHAAFFRRPQRRLKFRCSCGQQFHGLVHIPPRRGRRHPEPGIDLGERFAFTQVHQHQQCLLAGVEHPPHRNPYTPTHPVQDENAQYYDRLRPVGFETIYTTAPAA